MTHAITWEADVAARCLLGAHCVIVVVSEEHGLLRNGERVGAGRRKEPPAPWEFFRGRYRSAWWVTSLVPDAAGTGCYLLLSFWL